MATLNGNAIAIAESREVFDLVDLNGDGFIEFKEFVASGRIERGTGAPGRS